MAIRIITLCAVWACFFNALQAQIFTVTGADTPAFDPIELIQTTCLGNGIQVVSIEYEGVPAAVGRFDYAAEYVGLERGFLMTTGHSATASGGIGVDMPSPLLASVENRSTAYYPPLEDLTFSNEPIHDVAVYRIRFIPTGDSIMFRYVFASEEYPEYVCSRFNDVFGFFLTGPDGSGNTVTTNLAKVPGTSLPVSINSVNGGELGSHPSVQFTYCIQPFGSLNNQSLFIDNQFANSYPVYNGFTVPFLARAAVIPCQEYVMELVIADVGDALRDSGLFFEENSFCSFSSSPESINTDIAIVKGCVPAALELPLGAFSAADYPLSYTVSGSLIPGTDYVGLDSAGQIENPADFWGLNLDLPNGGEPGTQSIVIAIEGLDCGRKLFTIHLLDPLSISGPAQADCSGEPVDLIAQGSPLEFGGFALQWNTGDTLAAISVLPQGSTDYTLTYANEWGACSAAFTLQGGTDTTEFSRFLCRGELIEINGTLYGFDHPNGIEVFQNTASGCDSVVLVKLNFYPQQESALEAVIAEGEVFTLAGEDYRANGEYRLAFPDQNGCDSIVSLRLRVVPQTSMLTDSILVGQRVALCVDTSIFLAVASFSNACPLVDSAVAFELAPAGACLEYAGLQPGVSTACLVACDALGLCDTTYLTVSVFTNFLAAVDDQDSTAYDQPLTLAVLDNDWIGGAGLEAQYIVQQPAYGNASVNADGTITYAPNLSACLQEDAFTYAICNDLGCDTATVFVWLSDTEGACDAVWPGDVFKDGLVNQIDHWAIGLAYGRSGPVRPNASVEWFAQPMINWNNTITFIYEFDVKHTDCNGNGQVNAEDGQVVLLNWGKTHNMAPQALSFPYKARPVALERLSSTAAMQEVALVLGSAGQPLVNAYGLAFEVHFDPQSVAYAELGLEDNWLGFEGEDLMALQKWDMSAGIGYVSLVRTDQTPVDGFGELGRFRFYCAAGQDCGGFSIRQVQLLQGDGDIFEIAREASLEPSLTSTAEQGLAGRISLFPNPARDWLRIGLPAAAPVSLFAADGSIAWSGRLQQGWNEVAINTLPAGVYVLKVQLPEGVVAQRVVVY